MVAVKMQSCVLSVLLLNVYYSCVSSLYFHIGETEKKCFIEEIPDETMIIGQYILSSMVLKLIAWVASLQVSLLA